MQKAKLSPLYLHAADALSRARKLPVGPSRNDLRQLAIGLRWLDKKGLASKVLPPTFRRPPPDRRRMADYRAYIVDSDGHFKSVEVIAAPDDEQAVTAAQQFVDGVAVEV